MYDSPLQLGLQQCLSSCHEDSCFGFDRANSQFLWVRQRQCAPVAPPLCHHTPTRTLHKPCKWCKARLEFDSHHWTLTTLSALCCLQLQPCSVGVPHVPHAVCYAQSQASPTPTLPHTTREAAAAASRPQILSIQWPNLTNPRPQFG